MSAKEYLYNIKKQIISGKADRCKLEKVDEEVKKIINQPSYYPEATLKTESEQYDDMINWYNKYNEVNEFYKAYGFDVKGCDMEKYINYRSFMIERSEKNRKKAEDSQIVLLRDKYIFSKYMAANKLPVPEVFGMFRNGEYTDSAFNRLNLSDYKDFFIKEINGECASFVKHINDATELSDENLIAQINGKICILQKRIFQCKELNRLNPGAVNTLRIVTMYNNGNPFVLSSLLRVGSKRTGNVDNWAAGGLAVGISENGALKKYGYYKPTKGTREDSHPDTGIRFEGYNIPYFEEAKELCIKAHKCFYNIDSIGWDVAISDNGPVFLEGNDNWEISLHQICDRPLKDSWSS